MIPTGKRGKNSHKKGLGKKAIFEEAHARKGFLRREVPSFKEDLERKEKYSRRKTAAGSGRKRRYRGGREAAFFFLRKTSPSRESFKWPNHYGARLGRGRKSAEIRFIAGGETALRRKRKGT